MGPSCGGLRRLGARRSPASSFLHRLCDSESRPRASKSKKVWGGGQGRHESGTLDIQGFYCLFVSIWFILPTELEDSFRNDPWAIASLGHFIWKRNNCPFKSVATKWQNKHLKIENWLIFFVLVEKEGKGKILLFELSFKNELA